MERVFHLLTMALAADRANGGELESSQSFLSFWYSLVRCPSLRCCFCCRRFRVKYAGYEHPAAATAEHLMQQQRPRELTLNCYSRTLSCSYFYNIFYIYISIYTYISLSYFTLVLGWSRIAQVSYYHACCTFNMRTSYFLYCMIGQFAPICLGPSTFGSRNLEDTTFALGYRSRNSLSQPGGNKCE